MVDARCWGGKSECEAIDRLLMSARDSQGEAIVVILLSDALRLADRAAIAEVPATLEVTPGVPHVSQSFAAGAG